MAEFKSYTAKKMASLPEGAKTNIAKLGKHLRKFAGKPDRFNRELLTILDVMFAEGQKDVIGGDVVEGSRCIPLERGKKYYINCPKCNELIELDLESLLPEVESFGVYK